MEILFSILPGFIFWWFSKSDKESGGVLKISQWYFVLPFATFGIFFFLFYSFLISLILSMGDFKNFPIILSDFLSPNQKAAVPFIFSCISGALLGICHKKVKIIQKYLKLFVPEDKDNFDWIRRRLEEFGSLIITLKSNKVYYGVPKSLTKGWGNEEVFLEITPIASGFRDLTQKVNVTNDYSQSVVDDLNSGKFPFSVILAEREITSIVKYDENNFSFKNLLEKINLTN
jgi:hypothetical protein